MKKIHNFDEYLATTDGRIFSSIKFGRWQDPLRELAQSTNGKGYLRVRLMRGDRRISKPVHRLIAETFIPNPMNLPIVRHLDDNPLNNSVDNLAWGTSFDNSQDMIRNGTSMKGKKHTKRETHCKYGHEFTSENTYLYANGMKRSCRVCARRKTAEWQERNNWKQRRANKSSAHQTSSVSSGVLLNERKENNRE